MKTIQKAAKKAGVEFYPSHSFGRHSFATRLLKDGHSLVFVQKTGHWETIEMVSKHYGHLEHDAVTEHGAKRAAKRPPSDVVDMSNKLKRGGK
jgi:site-specific recombinase XerD